MARPKKSTKRNTKQDRISDELSSLERDLLAALDDRLEQTKETAGADSAEFLDIVSDSEISEMTVRLAESDAAKLDEIQEALQMLREGRYGLCRSCERKISRRRLKARPFATLCIACKEELERGMSPGDRTRRNLPGHIDIDVGAGDDDLHEASNIDELFRESQAGELL